MSIQVMVTYKVKAESVADNEALVRAVYAELADVGDERIHYATFKKEDGQTFVHIAFFPDADAQAALGATSAFQAFQADLAARCETPPTVETLSPVGAYNFTYDA